jgi:hypothetical protein
MLSRIGCVAKFFVINNNLGHSDENNSKLVGEALADIISPIAPSIEKQMNNFDFVALDDRLLFSISEVYFEIKYTVKVIK